MLKRIAILSLFLFALSIFFTSNTIGQEAKPTGVRGAESADAIPNKFIVVLKPEVKAAEVAAQLQNSRASGVAVNHVYGSAINGFAAELSQSAVDELLREPYVDFIEADQLVTVVDTQTNATWGLDRIDQRDLPLDGSYTYNFSGAGVDAYIIDTGIRTTHSEFSGRMGSTGFTSINDGNGYEDCNGHGTHVAGTVGGTTYGVAKDVTLYAVRVLSCSGSGSNSGVIAGVDWVTQNAASTGRPSVANMSLGGVISTALDNAVANSVASGVSYAVAAGNDNGNACNASPARVDSALTVGSTTSSDSRSSFSNFGTCVDVFAPGSAITSAWHTGDNVTNTISGTSMASPHVAGVVALILEGSPSNSPAQVFNEIVGNATQDKVGNPGSGSPNLLLCTDECGIYVPPTPTPVPDGVFCSSGSTALVDGGSVTTSINVSDGRSINDLNVSLNANHTWVGDLSFTLTHNGTSVTMVDRPGVPASTYGCSADDIDATLDDESGTPAENFCGSPALSGSLSPNNALSAFDGQAVAGTWELTIDDAYPADSGTLNEWCLVADLGSAPPTNTPVPPTATSVPPTATPLPPTNTPVPPTATSVPPTDVPPTNTPVPPTPTDVPPTNTPVPPTPTDVPPTNTPVPPTATPPPPSGGPDLYLSFQRTTVLDGVTYRDEDVVSVDTATDTFAMVFDGSAAGVGGDVDGFAILPDGDYLMSFTGALTAGSVAADDSDIVRYDPDTNSFTMYFDGSDVDLTTNGEDVDAIGLTADGDLLISTTGGFRVNGSSLRGADEDLLVFYATSLGDNTAGTFARAFDGSDVGLADGGAEDVNATALDAATGDIYLTTRGDYDANGFAGSIADVFVCSPSSTGDNTACTFSLYWSGSSFGVASNNAVDGLFVDIQSMGAADADSQPTAVSLSGLSTQTTMLWTVLLGMVALATVSLVLQRRR